MSSTRTQWLPQLIGYGPRDFAIRLPDGSHIPADTSPTFTLILRDAELAATLFEHPLSELEAAEAYLDDRLDIEGDMVAAIRLGDYLVRHHLLAASERRTVKSPPRQVDPPRVRRMARLKGRIHSLTRDRQAVRFHYDLMNEFFGLWLDQRMIYSCGYFHQSDDDLDSCQVEKLEYICRKLRLSRVDRLLDIGCGWGGLMIHAARLGAHVLGITLSARQAEIASERIATAGVSQLCEVRLCDYRQLERCDVFDKVVSIGMFEHVGRSQAAKYFDIVWRRLRPGGVFLNHAIADQSGDDSTEPTFTTQYVFPDGELLTLNETLRLATAAGFEVRDVESFREHYALTLRHWLTRLEARHSAAVRLVGEHTYRIWRLFLAGSVRGFEVGRQSLYQTLFLKPDEGASSLPLTRADWYPSRSAL